MAKIVPLRSDVLSPELALRQLADSWEDGVFGKEPVTVVIGCQLFHFGTFGDKEGGLRTCFDLQQGLFTLHNSMNALNQN